MRDDVTPEFAEFTVDGRTLRAPVGRTVSAAMALEGGDSQLRRTRRKGEGRGMFCGIGICFDCLVMIDGRGPLRACLVEVADGMEITSMDREKNDGAVER